MTVSKAEFVLLLSFDLLFLSFDVSNELVNRFFFLVFWEALDFSVGGVTKLGFVIIISKHLLMMLQHFLW
jgi:hypothetical protein